MNIAVDYWYAASVLFAVGHAERIHTIEWMCRWHLQQCFCWKYKTLEMSTTVRAIGSGCALYNYAVTTRSNFWTTCHWIGMIMLGITGFM